MTEARFRITIKSMAGTFIYGENDAAAGALMLGAARAAAAAHLGCQALYLTRKSLVVETSNEPSAEQLQVFQTLGDAYHAATGGADQTFFDRVTVDGITGLSADDVEVLAAAKRAHDQPGSSVARFTGEGRFVVLFTPKNATATAELLPSDDIADPTPKVDPADVAGLTLKAIK